MRELKSKEVTNEESRKRSDSAEDVEKSRLFLSARDDIWGNTASSDRQFRLMDF